MTFHKVNLIHLVTGWNNVYPNATVDVTSPLGAFTWRPTGSTFTLPTGSSTFADIDLDAAPDPAIAIMAAIVDHLNISDDDALVALDIANELVKKINGARFTPNFESTPPPWVNTEFV